jgi:hypothetical protein
MAYMSTLAAVMESVRADTRKIQSRYSAAWNYEVGRYSANIKVGNYQEALKALEDIEIIAHKWRKELMDIPEDKNIKIRKLGVMAAAVAAVVALAVTPKLHHTLMNQVTNVCRKLGMDRKIPEWILWGTEGIGYSLLVTKEWQFVHKGSSEWHARVLNKERERYKDDPNAQDRVYLSALQMLDEWLDDITVLKNGLREIIEEQKKREEDSENATGRQTA